MFKIIYEILTYLMKKIDEYYLLIVKQKKV